MTDAATFLIVGCGHWGNPGLDLRQVEFDDMLAPKRQSEIAIVLDRLVRFKPARVALEIEARAMPGVQRDYEAWRSGSFALTANERHQLGFRLAGMMGHDRVFGIDWHDHTREIGWDKVIEFALEYNQRYLLGPVLDAIEQTDQTRAQDAAKSARSRCSTSSGRLTIRRHSPPVTASTWTCRASARAPTISAPMWSFAGTNAT